MAHIKFSVKEQVFQLPLVVTDDITDYWGSIRVGSGTDPAIQGIGGMKLTHDVNIYSYRSNLIRIALHPLQVVNNSISANTCVSHYKGQIKVLEVAHPDAELRNGKWYIKKEVAQPKTSKDILKNFKQSFNKE